MKQGAFFKIQNMKIYLADTKQREHLGHNKTIPYKHHLESYYAIMKDKTTITKWSIFKVNPEVKK